MHNSILNTWPSGNVPLIVSVISLAAGALFWAAGMRVVRLMWGLMTGVVMASFAAAVLPKLTSMDTFSACFVGFVGGGLVGAFAYKLVQGHCWGVWVGLAAAVGYLALQAGGMPTTRPAGPVTTQEARAPQEKVVSVGGMTFTSNGGKSVVNVNTPENENVKKAKELAAHFVSALDQPGMKGRTAVVGILFWLTTMIVCVMTAKYVSWFTTAMMGASLMMNGAEALGMLYAPTQMQRLDHTLMTHVWVMLGLAIAGMVIQRWKFWPRPAGEDPFEIHKEPDLGPHPAMNLG